MESVWNVLELLNSVELSSWVNVSTLFGQVCFGGELKDVHYIIRAEWCL